MICKTISPHIYFNSLLGFKKLVNINLQNAIEFSHPKISIVYTTVHNYNQNKTKSGMAITITHFSSLRYSDAYVLYFMDPIITNPPVLFLRIFRFKAGTESLILLYLKYVCCCCHDDPAYSNKSATNLRIMTRNLLILIGHSFLLRPPPPTRRHPSVSPPKYLNPIIFSLLPRANITILHPKPHRPISIFLFLYFSIFYFSHFQFFNFSYFSVFLFFYLSIFLFSIFLFFYFSIFLFFYFSILLFIFFSLPSPTFSQQLYNPQNDD